MASMVMLALLDGGGSLVRHHCHLYLDTSTHSSAVINGVISFPIAVLAYFCLPDTPFTAKPNWLFTERVSRPFSVHKVSRV